ncbi:MAG: DUF6438 domain-containing protein [Bergeyella sp.]
MKKYLFTFFAFAVSMSCTSQKSDSGYSVIEYEATPCFGFCPIFKMTINSDRSAVLEAERFNFNEGKSREDFSAPREGTFKTTIKKEDYEALVSLLNQLNPKSLKGYYGDKKITDMATSFLRLKFSDHSEKQIQDYGKGGTPELKEVYDFFENLKHNQKWEKVK